MQRIINAIKYAARTIARDVRTTHYVRVEWNGMRKTHRATSFADAVLWAACYDRSAKVVVYDHHGVMASR